MQFLRIAGDDVPKTKKKRAPKVQKVHQFCLCFVCGFLITATVLKSISAEDYLFKIAPKDKKRRVSLPWQVIEA